MKPGLWTHQLKTMMLFLAQAAECAKKKEPCGYLVGHGTGCGKTRTATEILRRLYTGHKRLLPTLWITRASLVRQTAQEICNFSGPSLAAGIVLLPPGVPNAERIQTLVSAPASSLFIVNYHALGDGDFVKALQNKKFAVLVLDEAHSLRGRGVWTKRAIKLSKNIFYRLLLTGTPVIKDIGDLWPLFMIIDPRLVPANITPRGQQTWRYCDFRDVYFEDKNSGMPKQRYYPDWQPRPNAYEQIMGLLNKKGDIVAREDVLKDLPELVVKVESVLLEKRDAYNTLERDFVATIDGITVETDLVLTKLGRLLMLCNGIVPKKDVRIRQDGKEETCYEHVKVFYNKPAVLREILEGLPLNNKLRPEQVIIWSAFRPTYTDIEKVCRDLGLSYAFCVGEQTQKVREVALERFLSGEAQVLIAHPAAGGAGLNLQCAAYAIYYSKNYSLEAFMQSSARNYRAGSEQHQKIVQFHIVTENTIEEKVDEALRKGMQFQEFIMSFRRGTAGVEDELSSMFG